MVSKALMNHVYCMKLIIFYENLHIWLGVAECCLEEGAKLERFLYSVMYPCRLIVRLRIPPPIAKFRHFYEAELLTSKFIFHSLASTNRHACHNVLLVAFSGLEFCMIKLVSRQLYNIYTASCLQQQWRPCAQFDDFLPP